MTSPKITQNLESQNGPRKKSPMIAMGRILRGNADSILLRLLLWEVIKIDSRILR